MDITEMEAAAKKFEQEGGILEEIHRLARGSDNLYSHPFSCMFERAGEDGYSPYCEIPFEMKPDLYVTTGDESQEAEHVADRQPPWNYGKENTKFEVSEAPLSCAASTLPLESTVPNNFKGNANYNSGNPDSKKYSEASHRAYESSKSSQSCEESLSTLPSNLHHSGLKPIVDQDSDDSDSEIFRVKRRTSQKVEKREINDAMGSKHSDHQGFKRLKKVQLEGRCGALLSSDWCRTNESNYKFIPSTRYKDAPDCSSRERFARGSNIPISIKYKTLVNEEAISRQREQQIKDRLQLELGKTMREPPPIEIGSKRIKVRPVIPRDRGGWS